MFRLQSVMTASYGTHMNTTTSTGIRYTTDENIVDHAEHCWEESQAYLNMDVERPDWVSGDLSGIYCHTCKVYVYNAPPIYSRTSFDPIDGFPY